MGFNRHSVLVCVGFILSSVSALLRFSCSQLVVERLDPLVNPGIVGSPHLHQIIGGVRIQYSHSDPLGSAGTGV